MLALSCRARVGCGGGGSLRRKARGGSDEWRAASARLQSKLHRKRFALRAPPATRDQTSLAAGVSCRPPSASRRVPPKAAPDFRAEQRTERAARLGRRARRASVSRPRAQIHPSRSATRFNVAPLENWRRSSHFWRAKTCADPRISPATCRLESRKQRAGRQVSSAALSRAASCAKRSRHHGRNSQQTFSKLHSEQPTRLTST